MNAELKRLKEHGIKPNRGGVFILTGKQWLELPQQLKDDLKELCEEWDYDVVVPKN